MRNALRKLRKARKGNVVALTALFMVFMIGIVAFAVDLGYLLIARSQLQNSADSAALAGGWNLIDEEILQTGTVSDTDFTEARLVSVDFAARNKVCSTAPYVSINLQNNVTGDVVIGRLNDLTDPDEEMTFADPNRFNAITVRVKRTSEQNGEVPFFFGRIFGFEGIPMEAEATAALLRDVAGYRLDEGDPNIDLLPFALDEVTWDALIEDGVGNDQWSWDPDSKTISSGSDGILEVNLYPQGTGSPGNRGTVDIGSSNNSTAVIASQILNGISASDLEYHGGELTFDDNGELELNGDTGISAGVKDELASIKGQPRMIPIFRSVSGPGNNAMYVIVKFVGIRILDVKLTGSMNSKRVTIQPALCITRGAIPSDSDTFSTYVYSRVHLIR